MGQEVAALARHTGGLHAAVVYLGVPERSVTLFPDVLLHTHLKLGKYNAIPKTPDLERWNKYGGFDVKGDRLLYIDGTSDPWRDLCYHSTLAPQRYWTDEHPEHLINGAGHCWDLRTLTNVTDEPQFIRETTLLELRTVATWLREFKEKPYF